MLWRSTSYLKAINFGSSRVRDGVLIDAIAAPAAEHPSHPHAIAAATSNCIATPFLTQARKISRITARPRTNYTVPHIT